MVNTKKASGVLQKGFSLLEMIVAIAILGIAMAMLYRAAGGATRSVRVGEQYAYAVIMAQSLLDNNSHVAPNGVNYTGGGSGDGVAGNNGMGFQWRVVSTPVIIQDRNSPALLHHIVVTVWWPGGESFREFILHSVVPVKELVEPGNA